VVGGEKQNERATQRGPSLLELVPPPSPFSGSWYSGRERSLRGFQSSPRTVGTHTGHLPTTTHHVVVATSFVDNHSNLGLGPRNSTLGFSPLTHHPSQPRPVTSKRGAQYNHPQLASVAAGRMGQFKPGLGPNIFIPGAEHLPRPPSTIAFTNSHRLISHIGHCPALPFHPVLSHFAFPGCPFRASGPFLTPRPLHGPCPPGVPQVIAWRFSHCEL
jgi:hypothetical protein